MRPLGVGVLRLDVVDEITPLLAETVSRYLGEYPTYSIEMQVDTIGGDWVASRAIFTSLKNHGRRVTAFIRKAASGGALIVMAADHRQLDPHGHFFLHRPQGKCPAATLDEIANAKAMLMASRCRVPAARLRKWMDDTTTITAKQALSYGLVDEVPGLTRPQLPTVFL